MAIRPAWYTKDGIVIKKDFSFEWNPGFSISQKKKNIVNLHNAINGKSLEISTKSDINIGKMLSAFNLKLDGYILECVFQASKVFEFGGPYVDILKMSPRQAKHDERKNESGKLIAFEYNKKRWPLIPRTAFYDYIYICSVLQSISKEEIEYINNYEYFTDIEYNPKKSLNCQARAVALLKLILSMNIDISTFTQEEWIEFHKNNVKD